MRRGLVLIACIGCTSTTRDDIVEPAGPVTVRVMRGDDPVVNATVIFSGAAGNTLSTLATDRDGRITADIETNGIVTAIDPDEPARLFSITAMHANDFVEIPLDVSPVAMKPPVTTLVIEAPATAAPAQTDHFAIETPCGTFDTMAFPATFPISADCLVDARVPVIITAATPLGDLEHPGHGLAFVAGFASGATPTFAPGAWSTTCAQVDAFVADRMQITFYSRLGGRTFRAYPDFCTVGSPAAGATYAYPVYDFGEGAVTTSYGQIEGLRTHTLVRNFEKLPARVDVGKAPSLLAGDIRLVAMDHRGAEWTRDSALRDADVVIANLTWILPQQKFLVWKFAVAGDTTIVRLPDIAPAAQLAGATSRIAELHYYDASWLADADVPSLGFLDAYMPAMPFDATVRGFTEQFYPDAN